MSKDIPAFPVPLPSGQTYGQHQEFDGMTLRDYFAAKAMQGDWASQNEHTGQYTNGEPGDSIAQRAVLFYRMADAMLEARK